MLIPILLFANDVQRGCSQVLQLCVLATPLRGCHRAADSENPSRDAKI